MDLFRITKSKLREELLMLYITNPTKKYYLRELERILDFSVGNIRRELINLENSGLFLSENKGNLVYFFLNKKYPLLKEVKSIILKTSGVSKILRNNLKKIKGVNQAFIYGSFAAGDERADSDIDLMIIGKVDEEKLIEEINKIEKKLQRDINYTIYEKHDFKKKKEDGNAFIIDILKKKKIFLIGDENDLWKYGKK